jgi:ribose transport system permease protein
MAFSDRARRSAARAMDRRVGLDWLLLFFETRFGAHVHAIGDSAQASRATGAKILRLRFAVMLMSGVFAALAGLLYAGRFELLTATAAVAVGGTRLSGGVAFVFGALVGSQLMGMLNNGLILTGYQPSDQMIARA